MKIVFLVTLFGAFISVSSSYNILGIFPYNGKSHFDIFEVVLKKLAQQGHNLTVISHFPQKNPIPNYEDVSLSDNSSKSILFEVVDIEQVDMQTRFWQYSQTFRFAAHGVHECNTNIFSENVNHLLNSGRKFDVIIIEFFDTTCFLGFVHAYQAPFIGISSTGLIPWDHDVIANPTNPSYIQNLFLPFVRKNTFLDKVENTLLGVYQQLAMIIFRNKQNYEIARRRFGEDLPDLVKIAENASLFLVNAHFSLTQSQPLVPSVIEVAGLHIGTAKPLPQDIEKWIMDSPHGVIYFSLGSMIKGHTFPEEKRQMFLKAFARLPQRVLWKWETDMPGQPKNVMIKKWMPQFDILNHPNVKAFISHGGLLGTTESVHCGVPMLVMPQFGDQFANARAVEASGGGIMLDFTSLSEELIYNSLKTVLHPDFNKKAKELSERFRDRPLPPLDTAVYWVEYVARHKGAPHMRTAAVGMPFYQYLLLDVIAFLAVILFVFFYIFYFVTKAIFRKLFKSKSIPDKVKKQ